VYSSRNCTLELPSNIVISACLNYSCVAYVGCQPIPFDCRQNISIKNGSCEVLLCNNKTDRCELLGGKCFKLAALIAGLTGGGLAGVIVAAIICLATIGGGTLALASVAEDPEDNAITQNPLYEKSGQSGISPLHDHEGSV